MIPLGDLTRNLSSTKMLERKMSQPGWKWHKILGTTINEIISLYDLTKNLLSMLSCMQLSRCRWLELEVVMIIDENHNFLCSGFFFVPILKSHSLSYFFILFCSFSTDAVPPCQLGQLTTDSKVFGKDSVFSLTWFSNTATESSPARFCFVGLPTYCWVAELNRKRQKISNINKDKKIKTCE